LLRRGECLYFDRSLQWQLRRLYPDGAATWHWRPHGDLLEARIIGDAITVYKNNSLVLTDSDTTIPSGNPGIGFFNHTAGSGRNVEFGWTSFDAGVF